MQYGKGDNHMKKTITLLLVLTLALGLLTACGSTEVRRP